MNHYGRTAQMHWRQWLPTRYSRITDPETFFTALGEEIEQEVQALSLALAGNDPPNETYLEKLGRLNMARLNAESQVLREMALLSPEPAQTEPKS
jgi:hypothetical protein